MTDKSSTLSKSIAFDINNEAKTTTKQGKFSYYTHHAIFTVKCTRNIYTPVECIDVY